MSGTSCELRWASHPLRDEACWKSAALVLLIVGFSSGAWWSLESLAYGLAALVVLAGAMSRYLLPVRYSLTDQEVTVTHAGVTRRMPWTRFRNFYVHPEGVFLSPFVKPSRLDAFQGCFLRFHHNREEVLAVVRSGIQSRTV